MTRSMLLSTRVHLDRGCRSFVGPSCLWSHRIQVCKQSLCFWKGGSCLLHACWAWRCEPGATVLQTLIACLLTLLIDFTESAVHGGLHGSHLGAAGCHQAARCRCNAPAAGNLQGRKPDPAGDTQQSALLSMRK
jgi:hypothetical protein